MAQDKDNYMLSEGIAVRLKTKSSRLGRALEEAFRPLNRTESCKNLIQISDSSARSGLNEPFFRGGSVETSCSLTRFQERKFSAEFYYAPDSIDLSLTMKYKSLSTKIGDLVRRLIKGAFWAEDYEAALSYQGLWGLLSLALIHYDHAFLHAGSVVSPDNRSVVLIGAGGSGKTSSTLSLVEQYGYRYQAEDFAIVSKQGRTYLSPRPLSIYASDIAWGNRLLGAYKARFSDWEKVVWGANVLRGRNPMKRAPIADVFSDEQMVSAAELKAAFFIRRSMGDDFATENISPEFLTEYAIGASMREMRGMYEPIMQAKAALGIDAPLAFNIEKVMTRIREVYQEAFRGVSCTLITAPPSATPSDIAARVADIA